MKEREGRKERRDGRTVNGGRGGRHEMNGRKEWQEERKEWKDAHDGRTCDRIESPHPKEGERRRRHRKGTEEIVADTWKL